MFLSMYCSKVVKAKYSLINNIRYIPYQFLRFAIRNVKYTIKSTSSVQFDMYPKYMKFVEIVLDTEIYNSELRHLTSHINKLLKGLVINYIAYEPAIVIDGCKLTLKLGTSNVKLSIYEDTKIVIKYVNGTYREIL